MRLCRGLWVLPVALAHVILDRPDLKEYEAEEQLRETYSVPQGGAENCTKLFETRLHLAVAAAVSG